MLLIEIFTIIHLVVPLYVGYHTFHVNFAIKSGINNYENILTIPGSLIKLDNNYKMLLQQAEKA